MTSADSTSSTSAGSVPDVVTDLAGRVNAYLQTVIPSFPSVPANLRESMEYSLLGAGKRLRPVLVLLAATVANNKKYEPEDLIKQALPAAAAIEMIHCFSLIHDDLPAIDNDEHRRGRKTNHIRFSEDMAILAGDGLATLPYVLLMREYPDLLGGRLVAELSNATAGMIYGQIYDTTQCGFDDSITDDLQRLELIHRNKTGCLLRAACRMGGILGFANENELAALTIYSDAIGLMFQIVDDVLDITQSAETMGKQTGKDAAAGKLTYPALFGLDECRRKITSLENEAITALTIFDPTDDVHNMILLVKYLSSRKK